MIAQPPHGSVPVSVVIPAHQNEESLARTLERILACRPLPAEILLHLDAGWEPRALKLEAAPVPVRLLRSAERLGPGGGRQRLLEAAACEIIASFDDDSWPLDDDFFSKALEVMAAFPNAAVISPAVYLREKPVMPPLAEATLERAFEGSASLHRKSMHTQLPGYVPVPEAYGVEEADLALQITAAGHDILACPWLRAWHDRPRADNRHAVLPWIQNEVLLAYLRYPWVARPWGWLRAARHVWRQRRAAPAGRLLQALWEAPWRCGRYRAHARRYTLRQVWAHYRRPGRRYVLHALPGGGLEARQAGPSPRVLFAQYFNPGGYPPLEHASRILARQGWEVIFQGIWNEGTRLDLAPHPRVKVRRLPVCGPGLLQKMHYFWFALICLLRVVCWRPAWVYGSDAISTPVLLLLRRLTGCRVVYHEHDSPTPGAATATRFQAWVLKCRARLAHEAEVVVAPNAQRLALLAEAARPRGQVLCVWNCPSMDDVRRPPARKVAGGPLRVLYHGSIVPERFSIGMLEALVKAGEGVCIRLLGYEGPGCAGYVEELRRTAARLGVADRFEYLGPMDRHAMMGACAECDVGLALLSTAGGDVNMVHMTGASNKAFDYLSQGLAIIVPPGDDWRELYVARGCAVACAAADVGQIANVFAHLRDHRDEVREMGRQGRALIEAVWNYEAVFQPVLERMQAEEGKTADR